MSDPEAGVSDEWVVVEVFAIKGARVIGGDLRLLSAIAGGAKASLKRVDRDGRGWFCLVTVPVARLINLCTGQGWTFVTAYSTRSPHPFVTGNRADANVADCLLFRRPCARRPPTAVAFAEDAVFIDAATATEAQYLGLFADDRLLAKARRPPRSNRKSYRKQSTALGRSNDDDDDNDDDDGDRGPPPAPAQLVFGVPLRELTLTHYGVPLILAEMVDYLNTDARLRIEGLFRISASRVEMAEVQRTLDNGTRTTLNDVLDVHIVANLLKTFLKSLPEPLLPVSMLDFIEVIPAIQQPAELLQAVAWMVQNYIPEPNLSALKHLTGYLGNVVNYTAHNRMSVQNLALVLGPNLIWTPNDPLGSTALSNMRGISQLIQVMIQHNEQVFSPASDESARLSMVLPDAAAGAPASPMSDLREFQQSYYSPRVENDDEVDDAASVYL